LDTLNCDFVELQFSSLHGSKYTQDSGACHVHKGIIVEMRSWNLILKRKLGWHSPVIWYALHIGTSAARQVTGSRVATIYSQILGIVILVSTSILRGRRLSGPEGGSSLHLAHRCVTNLSDCSNYPKGTMMSTRILELETNSGAYKALL
jgi:hypothetical protein